MSVFLDTSALYALLVQTEDDHTTVADTFRDLADSGRRLVTSNYVLLETTALLQHRFGLDAVRDLEANIVPLLDVLWISESLHQQALQRLVRTDRRSVSLVDCSSFHLMEVEGIREALSLDQDFSREGFGLLPAAPS
jgi:predicted nucleic acid-binding protein